VATFPGNRAQKLLKSSTLTDLLISEKDFETLFQCVLSIMSMELISRGQQGLRVGRRFRVWSAERCCEV